MNKTRAFLAVLSSLTLFLSSCTNNNTVLSSASDTLTHEETAAYPTEETSEADEPEEQYVPSPIEDFKYSISDGTAFIEKYIGSDGEVRIPQNIDGIPVSAVGNAFWRCDTLESVFIPEGIESIDDFAFAFCSKLTSVHFPTTLKSIGKQAFLSCRSLSECELPDSAAPGIGAFTDTPFIADKQMLIIDSVLYDCDTEVTQVTIPDTVTEIADNAFNGCHLLSEIVIPEGVRTIGENAFLSCESLTKVSLPDSLEHIGKYCFAFCNSLGSITVPDGITQIEEGTFYCCKSLISVSIPDTVTQIGSSAFKAAGIQEIELPDGLTQLGRYAFSETPLESITIPEGVTSCDDLFLYCTSLRTVVFSGDMDYIDNYCFGSCGALESVSMKSIASCYPAAFANVPGRVTIYSGSDVYYSQEKFIKTMNSSPDNIYTHGDAVEVGGIMLTPKAYERAVKLNDILNSNVEGYKRLYDLDDTAIQKIKLWIIYRNSICMYNPSGLMSGSANGALLFNQAVCEGMAECMKVLCELAGIECVVIREYALNHAWVKVKIGGKWYNCDPTWCEYLLTDEEKYRSCMGGTNKAWDYSAYPDILSPDTPYDENDKYTITVDDGYSVAIETSRDKNMYSPYYQLDFRSNSYIFMTTVSDKSITTSEDKRFQAIEPLYIYQATYSQLEKSASENDYVYLTKFSDNDTTDLVLPENVVVCCRFSDCPSLRSVTYPYGTIEAYAEIINCPNLADVYLPDSIYKFRLCAGGLTTPYNSEAVFHYKSEEYHSFNEIYDAINGVQ